MMRRSIISLFCLFSITIPSIYGSSNFDEPSSPETFNSEIFHCGFTPVQVPEDNCKLRVNLPNENKERNHPYKADKDLQDKVWAWDTNQFNGNYTSGSLHQEYSQYLQHPHMGAQNYEESASTSMFDGSVNEHTVDDLRTQHNPAFIPGHLQGTSVNNTTFEQPLTFGQTINNRTEDCYYGFYDSNQTGNDQWTGLNMVNNIESIDIGCNGLSNYTTNVDPTVYRYPICDESLVEPMSSSCNSIEYCESNISTSGVDLNEMILNLILYRLRRSEADIGKSNDEKLKILNDQLGIWNNMDSYEDIVKELEAFNLTLPELDFIKTQANVGTVLLNNLSTAVDRIIPKVSTDLYENLNFLHILFTNKHNTLTYESIEATLSPIFFHSLSTDQFIDAMECILNNNFNLGPHDVKKVIELFFGYMDCAPDMKLEPNDVCKIIKVILYSDFPDSFEYVYLTWRMWGVITCEHQEEIMNLIEKLSIELPREIFLMVYLFILNPDNGENMNSEGLKEWFISKYNDLYSNTINYGKEALKKMCFLNNFYKKTLKVLSVTFDGSLLYFPDILENSPCCNNIYRYFSQYATGARFMPKYSLHVLYAFARHCKSEIITGKDGITAFWAKFCMSAKGFCSKIEEMELPSRGQDSCSRHCISMKTAISQFRMVIQDREYDTSIFEDGFVNYNGHSNNKMFFLALTFTMLSNEFVEKNMPRIVEILKSKLILSNHSAGTVCIKNLQGHFNDFDGNALGCYIQFIISIYYRKIKSDKNKNKRETYIYRYLAFNPEINIIREFLGDYITGIIGKNKRAEQIIFFTDGVRELFWSDYYYDALLRALPDLIVVSTYKRYSEGDKSRLHRLCVEFNNEDKKIRKMVKAIFKNYRMLKY